MDDESEYGKLKKKKPAITGGDLAKLERSPVKRVDDFQKTVVRNIPVEKIDTKQIQKISSPSEVAEKVAKFRALRDLGKKAMGVIPFAGAGYAALSGNPAMAADELAGDVPFVGQAYEAFKPADSGNVEEERQMLAERNAQQDYEESPARLARLRALQTMGR